MPDFLNGNRIKLEDGMNSLAAGNGVVHGHIHKYNNLTYIHGHVHHTAANNYIPAEDPVQPSTTTAPMNRSISCGSNKMLIDCQHFEFVNYTGTTEQKKNISNLASTVNFQSSAAKHQLDIDNRLFPTRTNLFGTDELIIPKKRKINNESSSMTSNDCNCNPKILEVCCDKEHSFEQTNNVKNKPTIKIEDEDGLDLNIYTTPQPIVKSSPTTYLSQDLIEHNQWNTVAGLPDIKCALTCEPVCSSDTGNVNKLLSNFNASETSHQQQKDIDDFEKFCRDCLDTTSNSRVKHEHHGHNGHHHIAQEPTNHASNTQYKENCHNHVVNSEMDMRILDDLWNITELYELPITKHENHNSIETNKYKEEVFEKHSRHHDHHHHIIQFHPHASLSEIPEEVETSARNKYFANSAKSIQDVSYERHKSVPKTTKDTAMTSYLHHHLSIGDVERKLTLPSPETDTGLNTIDFNWTFKNEIDQLNTNLSCRWNDCNEEFLNLIDLQKHVLKDHISKEETIKRENNCNWKSCDFEGDDLCALVNHINTIHGINFDIKFVDLKESALVTEKEDHHLLHCTFPDDHIKHTESFFCKWNGCSEMFSNAELLNGHIEQSHMLSGQSEYPCLWEDCGHLFYKKQKLVRHIKVHSGYKPFKCEVCDKSFSSNETLVQHKRIHSGEKPFKCDICGRTFSSTSPLKVHIRTHTGEKPLSCDICGKSFRSSSNLSKHTRTHQKKYKCVYCLRSFDTEAKLTSHGERCSK